MRDVVHFRVYCDAAGKRRYYKVFIFRTEEQMYEHFKKTNTQSRWKRGGIGKLNFVAVCQGYRRYDVKRRGRLLPDIGQILFTADRLGAGVVSHEMTHAVIYWADTHTKIDLAKIASSTRTDERIALVQGNLVNQFWSKFYKACERVAWAKKAIK